MSQEKKPVAYVYTQGTEFINPYIEQAFADFDLTFSLAEGSEKPNVAVMISSTDIYDVIEGMNYDENTPTKDDGEWAARESDFKSACAKFGVKPTILRCTNIIGTGMNGLPMRFARGIARGTLMTIKDNEAVMSVVHAVDVARVAHALASAGDTYNVTNGIDTRVSDLIDALAYRIKNKQVFNLGAKWARLLYGGEYFKLMTTSLTFNNIRMVHALNDSVQPVDVVAYMKNHDYSNDTI